MTVETVSCNNCGAPLEVGPSTHYVTCSHCGSRLHVKRTGSSLYTELLERIDRKTDAVARQLAELRYQAELERLDREWEQRRRLFLTTDKRGNTSEPSAVGSVVMGGVAVAFGLIFAVGSNAAGAPCFFSLFGLVFAGLGGYFIVAGPIKAREFQQAEALYRHRRSGVTVEQFLPPPDDEAR